VHQQGSASAAIGIPYRTFSPEHRAKLRAAKLGKLRSPEIKAKISATLTGRRLSPEHRAKLRAAKLGKPSPNKGKRLSEERKAKLRTRRDTNGVAA
jgi:hypothetical protein